MAHRILRFLCLERELLIERNDPALVYKKSAIRGEAHTIPRERVTGRTGDPDSFIIKIASMARTFPPAVLRIPANSTPDVRTYCRHHLDEISFANYKDPLFSNEFHAFWIIRRPTYSVFHRRLIKDIGP
jgi:hypothetical protein